MWRARLMLREASHDAPVTRVGNEHTSKVPTSARAWWLGKCAVERRMRRTIAGAAPYAWPYDGDLRPENTAIIVIDMQTDFCGKGGYVDLMGYDITGLRAC